MKNGIRSLALFCGLVSSVVNAQVAQYGQCGGANYTGDTTCVSPYVCSYQNDYYSQCLAGTATTTTTSKTTTTPTTTATTTKSATTTSSITTKTSTSAKTSTTSSKTSTTASKTTTTTTKTTTTAATTTTASSGSSRAIPSGAITIGKNGQGKYSTFAAALADTSSSVYYVYAGNYTEAVAITRPVKIYGQTSNIMSYSSNTVTVSRDMVASVAGSNRASAAIRIEASGVALYSISIENTYGKPVDQAQAIALSVENSQFGCYACQIRGYQDTYLASAGTQIIAKSLIAGAVDFIFGEDGSTWITGSTIQTLGSGCITASGRSTADSTYFVIDKSTITGTGSVYLGRPWRDYARVIYQNSVLPSTIYAAGWSAWSSSDPRTDHILFGEYANTGSGAWKSGRASFATQLTAPISIMSVLGSTSWVDSTYL